MNHRAKALLALCGALLLSAHAVALPNVANAEEHTHDQQPRYTLTLLTPPAAQGRSAALGISEQGKITGLSAPTSAAQPQFGANWTETGMNSTLLDQLDRSTFARSFSINDAGVSVGEGFDENGTSVPVRWEAGIATRISTLNTAGTGVANAINNAGTIAATASDGTTVRAMRLAADNTLTVLPHGEGITATNSRANNISPSGIIAGSTTIAEQHGDHSHSITVPTLWEGTTPTYLPSIAEDVYAIAKDVNDAKTAVGEYQQSGVSTAARWQQGALTPLPEPTLSGLPHTTAQAVNEQGDIVGSATKYLGFSGFGGVALLWDNEGVHDLNTLTELPEGVQLQSAAAINDAGQIVGSATTPAGTRGFLLTPTPTPTPPTVTVTGLKESYTAGDTVTLQARTTPETDEAHWHWFTKANGAETFVVVPNNVTDTFTDTLELSDDGTQVIARLYGHGHAVLGESAPVTLRVTPQPTPDPLKPQTPPKQQTAKTFDTPGSGTLGLNPATLKAGTTISVQLGATHAREWVALWLFSTPTLLGGDWIQLDNDGSTTVTIPNEMTAGEHRLAAYNAADQLIDWAPLNITTPLQPQNPSETPKPAPTDTTPTDTTRPTALATSPTRLAQTGAPSAAIAFGLAAAGTLLGIGLIRTRRTRSRN